MADERLICETANGRYTTDGAIAIEIQSMFYVTLMLRCSAVDASTALLQANETIRPIH